MEYGTFEPILPIVASDVDHTSYPSSSVTCSVSWQSGVSRSGASHHLRCERTRDPETDNTIDGMASIDRSVNEINNTHWQRISTKVKARRGRSNTPRDAPRTGSTAARHARL